MNFNFQKTRELMVENQLRPNRIRDVTILNLFKSISKENFIPDNKKHLTYSDTNINLLSSRGYLNNLHLAQLIQFSEITKLDKVLHIGGLTGYLTVIISNICIEITQFN